jgi:hypothetical protein
MIEPYNMADEVLATADELRTASQRGVEEQGRLSNAEKNEAWVQWFQKNGVRLLKRAVSLGKGYINVDVPYQPSTQQDQNDLVALRKRVRRMLPGCEVVFIEEEYEGEKVCVVQIEWVTPQSLR